MSEITGIKGVLTPNIRYIMSREIAGRNFENDYKRLRLRKKWLRMICDTKALPVIWENKSKSRFHVYTEKEIQLELNIC